MVFEAMDSLQTDPTSMSYICKVVEKTAVLLPLLVLSSTAAATATALLTSSFTATVTASSTATVGTLPEGYVRILPLPRVPNKQSTTVPGYYEDQYVVPTYISPRSIVESAAFAFSPAWHAIAINT